MCLYIFKSYRSSLLLTQWHESSTFCRRTTRTAFTSTSSTSVCWRSDNNSAWLCSVHIEFSASLSSVVYTLTSFLDADGTRSSFHRVVGRRRVLDICAACMKAKRGRGYNVHVRKYTRTLTPSPGRCSVVCNTTYRDCSENLHPRSESMNGSQLAAAAAASAQGDGLAQYCTRAEPQKLSNDRRLHPYKLYGSRLLRV